MARGRLRIYLGAAPGVGKTFAMLNEGRRRDGRGTDVVVAFVETHGRAKTQTQLEGLEVIPRRFVTYRDTAFEEMDLDAVLQRAPTVALVDELAHTNVPGSRHEKRWQDVHELLDAGIDVISTVNIQHLESLNDVVEAVTGVRQRETVPDWVVRQAEQVEIVDMTPEALRRRMAHGNIYAAAKVDAALANYFRVGNLAALRELALLWVADKVDEALQRYMADHDIDHTWETRERVVVALSGQGSGDHLIRRAARIAQRAHGELLGVHIRRPDGRAQSHNPVLEGHYQLIADLGGSYHEVVADDIADGLVEFASRRKATQIVLGAPSGRFSVLTAGLVPQVVRRVRELDVHVVPGDKARPVRRETRPQAASPLPPRRRRLGWIAAAALLPLITIVLSLLREHVGLSATLLIYLLGVCAVGAIGGTVVAVTAALVAALAANWYFTEPYGTLRIDDADQIVAVFVFLAVASLVGSLVGRAARAAAAAMTSRAEAEALVAAAGRLSATSDPVAALLEHLKTIFGQERAELRRRGDDGGWQTEVATTGAPTGATGTELAVRPDLMLCLTPGVIGTDDRRILDAFVGRVADAFDRRELQQLADEAAERRRADDLRRAILRSVSHDLRSPLASIKASATSLLQDDVDWTTAERRDFAETIDEEADRLDHLVANLLDMSRIETGTIEATCRAVGLEEAVAAALASLSLPLDRVTVTVSDSLPSAIADAALLERALANVVANALTHTPASTPITIEATSIGSTAVVRVVDRGPGVSLGDRDRVFEPFQRLGDRLPGGIGLGLAVAHGFLVAMDGDLTLEDTPGGGLTVTLTLPLAEVQADTDAQRAVAP